MRCSKEFGKTKCHSSVVPPRLQRLPVPPLRAVVRVVERPELAGVGIAIDDRRGPF